MIRDADAVGGLARYGQLVAGNSGRRLVLGGSAAVWLVEAGEVDLHAESTARHYLGTASAGTLLPGSDEPAGRLVARPRDGTRLRLIPVADLTDLLPGQTTLIASAVDAGLRVLQSTLPTPPPGATVPETGHLLRAATGQALRAGDDVRWLLVQSGELTFANGPVSLGPGTVTALAGTVLTAATETDLDVGGTEDLLALGVLWPNLANHHRRYLAAVDAMHAHRERGSAERLHRARQASERAYRQAGELLDAVATRSGPEPLPHTGTSAFRLVADATGITVPTDADDSTLEAITAATRCRSRQISLPEGWWRHDYGPLIGQLDGTPVALLPHRRGTDVVLPGRRRRRVDAALAAALGSEATMLYRPLPPAPVTGRALLRFTVRGGRADLVALLLTLVATTIAGLALPVLSGRILGEYVQRDEPGLVVQASLGVLAAGLVMAAFGMISQLVMVRLQSRTDLVVQSAVWDRLIRLPAAFFRRSTTGELASAALSVGGIREQVAGVGIVVLTAVLLGAVNLALMAAHSGRLTAVAVALFAVHALTFSLMVSRMRTWLARLVEVRYHLADLVYQRLNGLVKLRVAAAEGFAYAQWADQFADAQELSRRAQRTQNRTVVLNTLFPPLCTVAVLALVAGPAHGELSLAQFVSWFTAFGIALGAVMQATALIPRFFVIASVFHKLRPILTSVPESVDARTHPGKITGNVELSDVSFRYSPTGPLVLDHINLRISAGEFVAIVGPTGSGKSTLLRLLLCFETPTTGVVAYDHHDLRELDVTALRRQLGVVLQHSAPFAGSILDNIRGTGGTTLEEAWTAASQAGLADDIRRMPMGMSTVIPDGADTLSGGQRQRLMIARALTGRPRLIFLDEATSALDNQTQAIVTASIRALDATRVVIAHRLTTIMEADRVIVLEHGRIVQEGTPGDLLREQHGTFHRLIQRQT